MLVGDACGVRCLWAVFVGDVGVLGEDWTLACVVGNGSCIEDGDVYRGNGEVTQPC